MKKITQTLVTVLFVVLLFSFGTANGQTVVFDPDNSTKAIAITNLVVGAVTYNVVFQEALAVQLFGPHPGVYTFTTAGDASIAADAMNIALTDAGAETTGQDLIDPPEGRYRIAYEGIVSSPGDREQVKFLLAKSDNDAVWSIDALVEVEFYDSPNSEQSFALFAESGLGIDDETFGAAISVYPNPADNYLQIETTATITAINISDITGKVMQNFQFEVGASATTLDVSAFNSGLYFLKLEDDKGRVSVKKILIK